MTSFINRLHNLIRDFYAASMLTGNPVSAFDYFKNKDNESLARFRKGKLDFVARKEDWVGVREVFYDNEYIILKELLGDKEQPTILDLGANIGGFALCAFARWPQAWVISVEAAPDTFEILQKNQRIHPEFNWDVINAGVWKTDGRIVLDRRSISISHRVIEDLEGESIPSRSISSILNEKGWNQIDLIKIDIEGAEESVIPSVRDILKLTAVLIIEVHTDRIEPKEVYQTLNDVYRYCWRLKERLSTKPVLLLANEHLGLKNAIEIKLEA